MPTSSPEARQDGRTARSQRTRDAVIDAVEALLGEGVTEPSARRIAERAGVSARSIFAHFSSLDDLHRAVAERAAVRVIDMLRPIDPASPLADRIGELCAQRAKVNEEIGPLRRAAARQEPSSPVLAEMRANGREASRRQVARIFATELDPLGARIRRRRIALVDAAISGETWDLLRAAHGLPVDEARRAMADAVRALVRPDGRGDPRSESVGATKAEPTDADATTAAAAATEAGATSDVAVRTRVKRARRALAEIEEKIDRLVAAIEEGSPPDLLAPRLRELRTAKLGAERDLAEA